MLTGGPRLAVQARRRKRLGGSAALSLGLHLAIPLLLLVAVDRPEPPPSGTGAPVSVEIVADTGPTEAEKQPTPASAVPTEPLPPGAEAPPSPEVPPPTPEAQAPLPPPPQAEPPPPPPDQTEVAAVEPPAPEPPPPPQTESQPPPTEAQPPPAPPQRPAARPTPRRSPASAPAATAQGPEPTSAARTPPRPTEGPEASVRVEGADLGPDWIKQLQAWWDLHAFYPGEAVQKSVSGTVEVHFVVRPDGEVTTIHVEGGSGSKFLNNAAYVAFRDAHLHPFPPGTPAPKADVYVTLHYVLTQGQDVAALAKRPFTVTNKPVQATAAATMQQKICSGVLVLDSAFGELDSWRGRRQWAKAVFYRTPEGKPRLKFSTNYVGSVDVAVSEYDGSAGWMGPQEKKGGTYVQLRFALWPAGPDHVGGSVVDVYRPAEDGAIDLVCD